MRVLRVGTGLLEYIFFDISDYKFKTVEELLKYIYETQTVKIRFEKAVKAAYGGGDIEYLSKSIILTNRNVSWFPKLRLYLTIAEVEEL